MSRPKLEPGVNGDTHHAPSLNGIPKLPHSPELSPDPDKPTELGQTSHMKDEIMDDGQRLAEAKVRHEADLKKHLYEPPQAERIQDE